MNNNKSNKKKQVTSIDVAKLAGVSQTSVSRFFNPNSSRQLKPKTREKVLRAAKELGYKPNAIARSLISKKTDIIGIVMGHKTSRFYSELLTKFIEKIQKIGKQALVFNLEPEEKIDNIIDRVLQYQVDGLIITGGALSSDIADECERRGTPLVLFNRYTTKLNLNKVFCDEIQAGEKIADILLDSGHKKIACITGCKHPTATRKREKAFFRRLKERGISECFIEDGNYSYESGYEGAKTLLKSKIRPDAIFCLNDVMAMGAIDATKIEFNISIPKELSIIACDDTSMASWPAYSITTMKRPLDSMIDDAIDILEKKLKKPDMKPISKMFKMELVKRDSVDFHK